MADNRPAIELYGTTCRSCGHAMVFTTEPSGALSTRAVYRLLYLIGAVEVAPSQWVCWRCSLSSPAQRMSADYVQHQAEQIEHNLSSDDVDRVRREARREQAQRWRQRP